MDAPGNHQTIIDNLYAKYKSKGFIQEDEALTLMSAQNLSLQEIERITGTLLGMGVIFADESFEDDEDEYDRGQTDFNLLYEDVVATEPVLEQFVNEIRMIQPPQHREWMTLIPQYQAGNPYAINRLFEMYLRSVLKIAFSFSQKYNAPLMDTFEDGMEGLLKSFSKYDLAKNGVFPSYYPMWVMQNITRNMSFSPNPLLYFPVHIRTKLYQLFDNVEAAEGDLKSPWLIQSVVDELECTEIEAKNLLGFFEPMPSLDELLENECDGYFNDNGAFEDEMYQRAEQSDLQSIFKTLLMELKPREAEILEARYGLIDGKAKTLEEVGEMYDVTRERIRQIEAKALRKIRHPSRVKKLTGFSDVENIPEDDSKKKKKKGSSGGCVGRFELK